MCQIVKGNDIDGINEKFNDNKTMMNSFLLQIEEENVQGLEQISSELRLRFLERERVSSL